MKTVAVIFLCLAFLLTFTIAAPLGAHTERDIDSADTDIKDNPDVTAIEYGKRINDEVQYEYMGRKLEVKREEVEGEEKEGGPISDATAIEYGLMK